MPQGVAVEKWSPAVVHTLSSVASVPVPCTGQHGTLVEGDFMEDSILATLWPTANALRDLAGCGTERSVLCTTRDHSPSGPAVNPVILGSDQLRRQPFTDCRTTATLSQGLPEASALPLHFPPWKYNSHSHLPLRQQTLPFMPSAQVTT